MPVFAYVARDQKGALVRGDIAAPSAADAARLVRADGNFVVSVTAKGARLAAAVSRDSPAALTGRGNDRYRPADLIYFTTQLAVMTEAGVSLADALDACVNEGNSPRFARALDDVIRKVQGGSEFSAALADHPRIFSPVYVCLIRASEASGTLAPMLRRLSLHLEAQRDINRKIKGAVTYPIVMFAFAIVVTVFLLTYVLPKFTAIYAGREDKLPLLTRALIAFSNTLAVWWPLVVGLLVVTAVALFLYIRSPAGRLTLAALKLRVPLIGPLYHKTYLARSLRTLGTMIQSGVSMLEGVKLTARACGSPAYETMWDEVHDRLRVGQQISAALNDKRNVPKAVKKMLTAGERSGQLGSVMERVANFCEAELNTAIKALTALIEPAIVMFLGVIVGGLVLALLLPIFTISRALK